MVQRGAKTKGNSGIILFSRKDNGGKLPSDKNSKNTKTTGKGTEAVATMKNYGERGEGNDDSNEVDCYPLLDLWREGVIIIELHIGAQRKD